MIQVKSRYVGVLFGLGVIVWTFLIGRLIGGYWTGLISMILLAQHSLVFREFRLAMVDTILLFFIFGAIYLFLLLKSKKFKTNKVKLAVLILCGLFAGAAGSVKLNGFMVLILICLWQITEYVYHVFSVNSRKNKSLSVELKVLKEGMGIALLALAVFIGLHPFLLSGNPIINILNMVVWRRETNIGSFVYFTFMESIAAILEKIVWLRGEYNFFDWSVLQMMGLIVFIAGLVFLVYRVVVNKELLTRLFLFFFMGVLVIMGNYLTINWGRYYLPIMPLIAIIKGFGFITVIKKIRRIEPHAKVLNLY
jgi:4-amino-4-deoxy-L-arabinose transferase-like glycosyltransferase